MLASLAAPVVDRLRSLSRGELIRPGDPGYAAAQEHGLVCPIGTVGRTGVGGLTLGGGVGRLQRPFGLTVDNLTAVELVITDGRHVRAIEVEQPELFWAMRGAGTNFGVSRGDCSRHGRYRTAKCGLRVARPLVNR